MTRDWLDIAFGVAIAALLLGWFASANILQEIEVAVLGCFAALLYIGLQMRVR